VKDATQLAAAEQIYGECWRQGLEAILDDRDERPGVKFKDADLLGIPVRITVGNSFVKEGIIEVRSRRTRQERRVGQGEVVAAVRAIEAEESPT
jgi:prolyl-tRNA synthetase